MAKERKSYRLAREEHEILMKKIKEKFSKTSDFVRTLNYVADFKLIGSETRPLRIHSSSLYFGQTYDSWMNPYPPALAKAILTVLDGDSELDFLRETANLCRRDMIKIKEGHRYASEEVEENIATRMTYLTEYCHNNLETQKRTNLQGLLENLILALEPEKKIISSKEARVLLSKGHDPSHIMSFYSGVARNNLYIIQGEKNKK